MTTKEGRGEEWDKIRVKYGRNGRKSWRELWRVESITQLPKYMVRRNAGNTE